ncbi:MAG: membrane protein [Dethiobacter sp.]|jgi:uncharacterized membrane protein YczE|nr:membrane protein [Dethiobacter sp.]
MNKTKFIKTALRLVALFFGYFLIANGIVYTVRAGLGVSPWDVLHLGVSYLTGLSLGRVTQGVGLILVILSYTLKVRLYIGTLLNIIFIGLFVDLVANLGFVPVPGALWQRIALYLTGVAAAGFGIALYISTNLGAGPRDSLMLALVRVTSLRVGVIRTMMEVSVTIIGYILGGPLGIGTVLFALLVGWFMEAGFAVIRMIKKSAYYSRVWTGAQVNKA